MPNPKAQLITRESSRPASAEQRLQELGIKLPVPPEPFGTYVEAVQTGNLLFLSGCHWGRIASTIEGSADARFGAVTRWGHSTLRKSRLPVCTASTIGRTAQVAPGA